MFNKFQKAAIELYEGGTYSRMHCMDEVNRSGDGLFIFIMNELGGEGGDTPATQVEAKQRIETAIGQLDEVLSGFGRCS